MHPTEDPALADPELDVNPPARCWCGEPADAPARGEGPWLCPKCRRHHEAMQLVQPEA